jgi:hypothetical protein
MTLATDTMKNTMFRNPWLSPEMRVNQLSLIHAPQSTMLYHPLLEDAATARYAGYEQSTPAGDRDCAQCEMANG